MIQINLLPVKKIQARLNAIKDIVRLACCLGAVLVLLIVVGVVQQGQVKDMNDLISKLTAEKESFQGTLTEIQKLKDDKEVLDRQLTIIKNLKQSSQFVVRILDELAKITPPNLVWLQSLSLQGDTLSITCMAINNPTVAQYMEAIDASPYFSDPDLPGTALSAEGGRERRSFSLKITTHDPNMSEEVKDAEKDG